MVTVAEFRAHPRSPYGTFRLHVPEDSLAIEERARRQRVMGKFPLPTRNYDIPSFHESNEVNFKRYNESGDRRADAPRRQNTPVVDPTSGFTSVGADAEDGNYKPIEPLVVKDHRPQSAVPYGRPITSPIPELRAQNAPWESRNKDLESFHPKPKQFPDQNEALKLNTPAHELVKNKEWRDAVALRAFYTSSTQKLYEGADWSSKLRPGRDPPPTTLELRPDMVALRFATKRYEPQADTWQKMGSRPHSWDYVQSRNGHYTYGPIDYCSHSKKVCHIPGYTGCNAGIGEKDNPRTPYTTFTMLRTPQPRYTNTARKGNIPGYTGCVLFSGHQPAHSKEPQPKAATTHRIHKTLQLPNQVHLTPFKRTSVMSKTVTLTHPFNPFNKVE